MKYLNFNILAGFGYILIFILLTGVAIGSILYDIPVYKFTADPTASLGAHPFTGLISNIGVLLWCSTVAICFFTFIIYRLSRKDKISIFLFFSALLSLILLIDDLFLFHENIFPYRLHIPQKGIYLGYGIILIGYLYSFRGLLLEFRYKLLVAAILLFGLSIGCDVFLPQEKWEYFIEDSFKILGIFSWFLFYTRTCYLILRKESSGN